MKKKYLTEEKFNEWVNNHFVHLVNEVMEVKRESKWHNKKLNFILTLVGLTLAVTGIGVTIALILVV